MVKSAMSGVLALAVVIGAVVGVLGAASRVGALVVVVGAVVGGLVLGIAAGYVASILGKRKESRVKRSSPCG